MLIDGEACPKGHVERIRCALDCGVVCFHETAPLRERMALFIEPSSWLSNLKGVGSIFAPHMSCSYPVML